MDVADSKEKEATAHFGSSLEAANAFLTAERVYVDNGLRVGFETFLNRLEVHCRLNKTIISETEIPIVFGNYSTLYNANSNLLSSLNKLRLDGEISLRDGIGKVMVDFIPYLKLYIDYIVKKQDAMDKLAELKKGNKKFREFLKINEACCKRKLKSFLDEPVTRLPQYLQGMASLYEAMTKESGKNSEASETLRRAIVDIQKVTDEIALKSKDKKARRLVGQLQDKIFKNKILLIASHRYVVAHSSLKLVQKKSASYHHFILCNDILCIATEPSKLMKGSLVAVFPLIGVRVLKNPLVDESLANEGQFRFAIVPQNKNFTPSESSAMGSAVVFCSSEEELEYWIDIIEETVDEEEHNLRPCNPVDLEKRLRKEKCSNEGLADTITITDENKKKEIEEWKHQRQLNPRVKKSKPKPKAKGKAHKPKGGANGADSASTNGTGAASGPAPPSVRPPSASQGGKPMGKPPSAPSVGPPQRKSLHSGPPPKPPGKGAPPPSSKRASHGGPPPAAAAAAAAAAASSSRGPPPKPGGASKGAPKAEEKKAPARRANLLGSIATFKRDELKKADRSDSNAQARSASVISNEPETMGDLLHNTLANYRQFVMDEDDDNQSDEEWE